MSTAYDLVCFSHLRWDFVYQRPQHLLTRGARDHRVFFIEEPLLAAGPPQLAVSTRQQGVHVVVPQLPPGLNETATNRLLQRLLDDFFAQRKLRRYVLWYYTPLALPFSAHLKPLATIYDCMDELSLFKGASPAIAQQEAALFSRADLVFTGGDSLYAAKREHHPAVYAFPSSVDVPHFARARRPLPEPADQAEVPHPRLGFFGVIDERMDLELIADIAALRPDWQFVMVGPVVKIDAAALPRRANVRYLGSKRYEELPDYLAGWEVALLPFAQNAATRYISPTKTPEYLAAGRPVVSTPIRDVVHPYGDQALVRIADTAAAFVIAIEQALAEDRSTWLQRVDAFLGYQSWDRTWARMHTLIDAVIARNAAAALQPATRRLSSAMAVSGPALPGSGLE